MTGIYDISNPTGITRNTHQIIIDKEPWFSGRNKTRFKLTVDGKDRIVVDNRETPRTTVTGEVHLTGDLISKANILPSLDNTGSLGTADNSWQSAHVGTLLIGELRVNPGDTPDGRIYGPWVLLDGATMSAGGTDLAQRFAADTPYGAGTVVVFGGSQEITASTTARDKRVAGVIASASAFRMGNTAGSDASHPYVALKGRVRCRVIGPVSKGDALTTSDQPGTAQRASDHQAGTILGKALNELADGQIGMIDVFVALM